jgi:hypothetical protein
LHVHLVVNRVRVWLHRYRTWAHITSHAHRTFADCV